MSDNSLERQETLLHHLNELRIRATRAIISLAICTILSFIFAEDLLRFLTSRSPIDLTSITPSEPLQAYFKVSLMAGGILSMPFILYQLWQFVSPGLEKSERRAVYIFIPSAVFLFLAGIVFTWMVLLPAALNFLANFLNEVVVADWTMQEYIGFVTSFLFWIGVSFEMPLVFYLFGRTGFLEASALRENWRVAVVGIAIAAAIITPSVDPVTMLLTMAPMLILYILSIFLTGVGYRQFLRSGSSEPEVV